MLQGKTVLLGITGSIATYKVANLASMLVKLHADVHVIMTKNACQFITPVTFETLTGNKCITDTFDRNFDYNVEHVSLAKKAAVVLVAPATANIIGKLAHGICDDMLTTTYFASKAPKLIAPAMNTQMWENPLLQDNLDRLKHYGAEIITPSSGRLACGDIGSGKLPSEEILLQHILKTIALPHDMKSKSLLITAGPTQEFIDPVRFITNPSSGKMGYAIAKIAALRGAKVTLVSGPVAIESYAGIEKVDVKTAEQMYNEVTSRSSEHDIIIMCSAVADYTPAVFHEQKMKKGNDDIQLQLKRTKDILQEIGIKRTRKQYIVGFSMETENLIENSRQKLDKKGADMICANSISQANTGFGVDTNRVTIITRNAEVLLPLCSKEETAKLILDEIITRI